MTPDQIVAHFGVVFPDRVALGWTFEIEEMAPFAAPVRLPLHAGRDGGATATYAFPESGRDAVL